MCGAQENIRLCAGKTRAYEERCAGDARSLVAGGMAAISDARYLVNNALFSPVGAENKQTGDYACVYRIVKCN